MKHTLQVYLVMALIAATISGDCARAQGSLTPPPGAPAPTMKTLDQLQPWTPLKNSSFPVTITSSGCYYLTETINVASTNTTAITINADNVTINLNGYTLNGPGKGAGGTGVGIHVPGGHKNIQIKNGNVANWGSTGINCNSKNVRLEGLVSESNGGQGVNVVSYCFCKDVQAHDNSFMGFQSQGNGAQYVNCTASQNGSDGFAGNIADAYTDCTAGENNGIGFYVNGVAARLVNCTAVKNHVGFEIGNGTLSACVAYDNTQEGFSLAGSSIVGCVALSNTTGFDASNSTIGNCTSTGNTTNYVDDGGNIKANNKNI